MRTRTSICNSLCEGHFRRAATRPTLMMRLLAPQPKRKTEWTCQGRRGLLSQPSVLPPRDGWRRMESSTAAVVSIVYESGLVPRRVVAGSHETMEREVARNERPVCAAKNHDCNLRDSTKTNKSLGPSAVNKHDYNLRGGVIIERGGARNTRRSVHCEQSRSPVRGSNSS